MCGPVNLHWGLERRWVLLYGTQRVLAGLVVLVAGATMLFLALPRPTNLLTVGTILATFGFAVPVVAPLFAASEAWFLSGMVVWPVLPVIALGMAVAGGSMLGAGSKARGGKAGIVVIGTACGLVLVAVVAVPTTVGNGGATFYNSLEATEHLGYVSQARFGVENNNVSYGSPALDLHDVNLLPAAAEVSPESIASGLSSRPDPAATPVGPVPLIWQAPRSLGITPGIDVRSHGGYGPCASPQPFYVAVPVTTLDLVGGGTDRVLAVQTGNDRTDYLARLADGLIVRVRREGTPTFNIGDAVEVRFVGPPSDYGDPNPGAAPGSQVNRSTGEVYESVCAVDYDLWEGGWIVFIYGVRIVVLGGLLVAILVGWATRATPKATSGTEAAPGGQVD